MMRMNQLFLATALFAAVPAVAQTPGFHVANKFAIGGTGNWDYLTLDAANHRVFIARTDRVMVIDINTGKVLGEVSGFKGAHGVALSPTNNRGFATSGEDSSVVMFDLTTYKVLGRIHAADDADAILYDAGTKRVFSLNGDANSATVIDAIAGKGIGTIALGGKPESGISVGNGKIFVNISDQNEVVEIDAATLKITRRWSIAPCGTSTGMAIDLAHSRLFSVCRSKHLGVSNITTGKLVTTVPIGGGVDGAAFDPATQLVFASNGDGTLTVIHEDTPDKYTVLETVLTGVRAKTMALDPATHRIYLGATPAAFVLMVMEKKQ